MTKEKFVADGTEGIGEIAEITMKLLNLLMHSWLIKKGYSSVD